MTEREAFIAGYCAAKTESLEKVMRGLSEESAAILTANVRGCAVAAWHRLQSPPDQRQDTGPTWFKDSAPLW